MKERLFAHPDTAGRAGRRRPRADRGLQAEQEGRLRDLRRLLLAAVRPRPLEGAPAPPAQGLAGDRRHGARPRGPARLRRRRAPRLLDPAGRSRRAADRPEADPRRLEAARGHRHLSRLGPQRALRRQGRLRLDRADPALAEAAARAPGALGRAHRAVRLRPRRRRARARSTGACSPRSSTWPSRASSPTVTSLKCGHGFYTAPATSRSTAPAAPWTSRKINGIPILGHQEAGGITEQTVRRLMRLQGTMQPHQIISLLEIGGPTMAMADHADHIHVGFKPLFGPNRKLGRQAMQVLKPGQWSDLIARLGEIDNPVVPTKPSKYALPVHKRHRASDAHSRRVAPRRRHPRSRRPSGSSSSSSASCWGRRTAATWRARPPTDRSRRCSCSPRSALPSGGAGAASAAATWRAPSRSRCPPRA